jgi:hypothetical protein
MKKSLKTLVLAIALLSTLALLLNSCTGSKRGYGCPGQGSGMGFSGY